MLAATVVVSLFPFGTTADLTALSRLWTGADVVAFAGNSVIDHVSKCDAEPWTLPDILAARTGKKVADLSYGGQTLGESVAYAAAALRSAHVGRVVVGVSLFQFADEPHWDLRRLLFFRLLNPAVETESLHRWIERVTTVKQSDIGGFTYAGRHYPDYDRIKTEYFAAEKARMPCPEDDGQNRAFIEAYYHQSYVAPPLRDEAFALLSSLGRDALRQSKPLTIVLLPIDYELLASLQPGMAAEVRHRAKVTLTALHLAGLHVIDLSGALANRDFADRWCACGHLLIGGRHTVGAAIAAALPKPAALAMH